MIHQSPKLQSHGPSGSAVAPYGEAFCAALAEIGVGAAELSADGRYLAVNRRFCEIVGLTADEIRGGSLATLLQIDTGDLASGTTPARTTDSLLQRKDGRNVWIRSSVSAVRDPISGSVGSLLLVIADVTPKAVEQQVLKTGDTSRAGREVAGRLINALEAERSRIGRELHDDIAQSLAVLAVQMHRAGKPVSGTGGRQHADVPELAERLKEIASRVGRLSHGLHSSKLEYLGLEKVVRGACREFSDVQPMTVDCVCEQIPAELDGAIGLCVLRVLQEALHNVAKHSRGTRVSVGLKGGADSLTLIVNDDGVGFDVVEATMAEGIGLISMRERVSFVGGTFLLRSARGQGTRIEAHVPLVAALA